VAGAVVVAAAVVMARLGLETVPLTTSARRFSPPHAVVAGTVTGVGPSLLSECDLVSVEVVVAEVVLDTLFRELPGKKKIEKYEYKCEKIT
jgi:hypothetical protein